MSLPMQSVGKLARECFKSKIPMKVDADFLADFKRRLHAHIEPMEEIALRWGSYQHRPNVHILAEIALGQSRYGFSWYGGISITLANHSHSTEGEERHQYLFVRQGADMYPLGNEEELMKFLRLCRERVARRKGQEAKRNKVRNLRIAAVLARVHQLAQKFQFDYAHSVNSVNVNLMLRFDNKDIVEITLPMSKFEESLPQVEASIPTLRALADAGLFINTRPKQARQIRPRSQWVVCESPRTE